MVLVPAVVVDVDDPCVLSRNVCLARDNRRPIQPKGAATESAKEEEEEDEEEELLSTPPSTEPVGVAEPELATPVPVDVGSEELVDSVDDDDDDCELLLAVRKLDTDVRTEDPADFN